MIQIRTDDAELEGVRGAVVAPAQKQGVDYQLVRRLGAGGMCVVYEAIRRTPRGETPTVVKIFLPQFVLQNKQLALTAVSKETTALGLLNERVPPTPFVVRFYDFGFLEVSYGSMRMSLPWLSLEYVQGGALGTTLVERVEHTRRAMGHAFDIDRAARAIENLCEGMTAVHEVGVVHRDIKPDNILCCGFGADEIFKITDFGIARASATMATFGEQVIGTPGYAPMEQMGGSGKQIGPWTDVFALGALAFYMLTGEDLFRADTLVDAALAIETKPRRSIREAPSLEPELRWSAWRCERIDEAIARATASRPQDRPRSARELGTLLLASLRDDSTHVHSSRRPLLDATASKAELRRRWVVRNSSGDAREVRHVAWNSDGTALAVTSQGLAYWTGTDWQQVPLDRYPAPAGLRFVRQTAANQWLIGGEGATLATFTGRGLADVLRGQDPSMIFERASGDLNGLALAVATLPRSPPLLCGIACRRWVRPMPLEGVAMVNALEPIADATWLVAGRTTSGHGFAALYEPLQWSLRPLPVPSVQAFLACASLPDLGVGLVVGTDGAALLHEDGQTTSEILPDAPPLSAAALDPTRLAWASSTGRIYSRPLGPEHAWRCEWSDPAWKSPLISLQADGGLVRAMAIDGAILEGRLLLEASTPTPRTT